MKKIMIKLCYDQVEFILKIQGQFNTRKAINISIANSFKIRNRISIQIYATTIHDKNNKQKNSVKYQGMKLTHNKTSYAQIINNQRTYGRANHSYNNTKENKTQN